VKFPDESGWRSRTPGYELHDFPGAPAPADEPRQRLRRMKEMSERFSVTLFHPSGKDQEELKRLIQPLWRYSDADEGLVDGALFGIGQSQALCAIELHRGTAAEKKWRYGIVGMSAWALSVRLDGKEVWKKPSTPDPANDNWAFRWEAARR
jgi:hypothetical protein